MYLCGTSTSTTRTIHKLTGIHYSGLVGNKRMPTTKTNKKFPVGELKFITILLWIIDIMPLLIRRFSSHKNWGIRQSVISWFNHSHRKPICHPTGYERKEIVIISIVCFSWELKRKWIKFVIIYASSDVSYIIKSSYNIVLLNGRCKVGVLFKLYSVKRMLHAMNANFYPQMIRVVPHSKCHWQTKFELCSLSAAPLINANTRT